jgi:hypothetical protein
VVGRQRDPDADAGVELVRVDRERCSHRLAQLLGKPHGVIDRVFAGHQDGELVTPRRATRLRSSPLAVTSRSIRSATWRRNASPTGGRTCRSPPEVIDIDQHQRHPLVGVAVVEHLGQHAVETGRGWAAR